jgi:hypothetical protein
MSFLLIGRLELRLSLFLCLIGVSTVEFTETDGRVGGEGEGAKSDDDREAWYSLIQ